MKRVITLLMAAVMVIGTSALASAVEFKASGHMHIALGVQDNGNNGAINPGRGAFLNKDAKEDNFYGGQRFRPKLTMSAEGVTAVFEAQQHQFLWGDVDDNAGTSNVYADVRVRNAYIDFVVPSTIVSLKVGFQQLNLPSIWGHPIFQTRTPAVLGVVPFSDQVALAAFFTRPVLSNHATNPNQNSIDMYGALLPLDFGTVKATPYFVYSRIGGDLFNAVVPKPLFAGLNDAYVAGGGVPGTFSLNDNVSARYYVAGANIEVAATEALTLKFDGIYTKVSSDNEVIDGVGSGYHLATAIDYALPIGTPGVFGWYSSGADKDGKDFFYSPGLTDGFGPTSLGMDGANTFWNGGWVGSTGMGTWGIGAQFADVSFVDSLKHTLRAAYIKGTNNNAFVEFTKRHAKDWWSKKDSFVEIDLDSTWAIYENLAAVVELGMLIPDNDVKDSVTDKKTMDDNAYRGQLTLRFSF